MYQGDYRNQYSEVEDRQFLSSPIVSQIEPVYFISEVESYFLQAEACELGWGTEDDKGLYELAIDTHFERLGAGSGIGIYETGANAYAKYPLPDGVAQEENLEAIIFQKWIAMTNTQGMESFFEHNRTGYPRESTIKPGDLNYPTGLTSGEFTVSVTGVLSPPVVFPKRLLYPSSEQSTNPNTPAVVPLNVPVWWDARGDYQSIYTKK
jgi:hypothetical protein